MRSLTPFILLSINIIAGCTTYTESDPSTALEWFDTLINVDRTPFKDIQHFTIQDIDFSHHFKFTFTDSTDLESIIRYHELAPPVNSFSGLSSDRLPPWYRPTDTMEKFKKEQNDIILILWIDEPNNTAYFEYIKI